METVNPFVCNYVGYHLGKCEPQVRGRIKSSINEWRKLRPPPWILDLVEEGLKIPFEKEPPIMVLPNNKSAMCNENINWVRETLHEYLKMGFVKKVLKPPHLILPLQVSVHSSGKKCLIHDESPLNDYVLKNSFKQDGWEDMLNFSIDATCGINFDLKKVLS